jgi:hypothetical protein
VAARQGGGQSGPEVSGLEIVEAGDLSAGEKTAIWLFGIFTVLFLLIFRGPSIAARGLNRRVWTYFGKVWGTLAVIGVALMVGLIIKASQDVNKASSSLGALSSPTTVAQPGTDNPNSPLTAPTNADQRGIEKTEDEARTNCGPVPASTTDLLTVITGIERNRVAAVKGNTACGLLAVNDPAWVSQQQQFDGTNVRLYAVRLIDPPSGTAYAGETVTWESNSGGYGFDIYGNGSIYQGHDIPASFTHTGTLSLDSQGWHLADVPSSASSDTGAGTN